MHSLSYERLRYGVTANITAFHAVARGSIPRIGSSVYNGFLFFTSLQRHRASNNASANLTTTHCHSTTSSTINLSAKNAARVSRVPKIVQTPPNEVTATFISGWTTATNWQHTTIFDLSSHVIYLDPCALSHFSPPFIIKQPRYNASYLLIFLLPLPPFSCHYAFRYRLHILVRLGPGFRPNQQH